MSHHPLSVFSVATFVRDTRNREGSCSSASSWITRSFGKIGVIQANSYLENKLKEKIEDLTCEKFSSLVFITKEINPNSNTGILILNLLQWVDETEILVIDSSEEFLSFLESGVAILNLRDNRSLLWETSFPLKKCIYQHYEANVIVPNLSVYVEEKRRNDPLLKINFERSKIKF